MLENRIDVKIEPEAEFGEARHWGPFTLKPKRTKTYIVVQYNGAPYTSKGEYVYPRSLDEAKAISRRMVQDLIAQEERTKRWSLKLTEEEI